MSRSMRMKSKTHVSGQTLFRKNYFKNLQSCSDQLRFLHHRQRRWICCRRLGDSDILDLRSGAPGFNSRFIYVPTPLPLD